MVDFSNLSFISAGELIDSGDVPPPDFVLKGLESAHVGMLIAAPEMGKSHLCFSIAIEHSTSMKLLGISAAKTAQKTLLISAEDSVSVIKNQLSKKIKSLPAKVRKQARDNIYPFSATLPFVTPNDAALSDQNNTKAYTDKIIELIRELGISLVVIDTVSEVIGSCDEVKHDRVIKTAFQRIARESGAALLLVHHVNKAEIKGEHEVSMASGAGLTTVMRLSKLILGITSSKRDKRRLNYLKANYLSQEEKQSFDIEFNNGVLVNTNIETFFKDGIDSSAPERPEPIIVKGSNPEADIKNNKRRSSIRKAF
ncbi:TPA: AAA family ATPase [Vibrio parahaemolyticus]|nr:AAA family ATPase [Vibrio parahaemolyticus]